MIRHLGEDAEGLGDALHQLVAHLAGTDQVGHEFRVRLVVVRHPPTHGVPPKPLGQEKLGSRESEHGDGVVQHRELLNAVEPVCLVAFVWKSKIVKTYQTSGWPRGQKWATSSVATAPSMGFCVLV